MSIYAKVKPLADKLRACAAEMSAAGVGMHATNGHVIHVQRIANDMEAQASAAAVPYEYRPDGSEVSASAQELQAKATAVLKAQETIAAARAHDPMLSTYERIMELTPGGGKGTDGTYTVFEIDERAATAKHKGYGARIGNTAEMKIRLSAAGYMERPRPGNLV